MTALHRSCAPQAASLIAAMPSLRRLARALTGEQATGDHYALAALDALTVEPDLGAGSSTAKLALFRAFLDIWATTGQPSGNPGSMARAAAGRRAEAGLVALEPVSRAALLLSTLEGLPLQSVGEVLRLSSQEAGHHVARAQESMASAVGARILIIEDEPIIAMNLEMLASDAGHHVSGIARTRARAVELGMQQRPDLILADIHLADHSSGIEAVSDLMDMFGDIPVIFITAFPERLLTGAGREPAFLIAKPFEECQVESAIAQAVFFTREQRAVPA
ncbi:MAG: response regulator [Pseudomonadota bacterium]